MTVSPDLERAFAAHQKADIHGTKLREYIQNIVLGGNDGIVTTFAVVAGTAGAHLSAAIVIILGVANLLADGISMGAGVYLSMKSERDTFVRLKKEELQEIEDNPEVEREEVRRAFRSKGFAGELLEHVVKVLTTDKNRWADAMMHEEHGLLEDTDGKPLLNALITFAAFVLFGSIPVLPYLFGVPEAWRFLSALIATTLALILLGIARSSLTQERLFRGTLEIVGVGMFCAAVAYGVGIFLRSVV